MNLGLLVPYLAIYTISTFSEALLTQNVALCRTPDIPNARLSCTTKERFNSYVHQTHCTIYCNKNYAYVKGPKAIDCYRGVWLHSGKGSTRYNVSTVCRDVFSVLGDGRSMNSISEPHDWMCSKQFCHRRYYGITERRCESLKCCWNSRKRDCYQFLELKCQVPLEDRTTCPETWYGMPKNKCEAMGCCYDPDKSICYRAKPEKLIEPTPPGNFLKEQEQACGDPSGTISNGHVGCKESDGFLICKARCHDRYVLDGVSERSCYIESREWSPGIWKCRLAFCEPIPKMLETFVDCTNGERIGSTCAASCALGYALQSNARSAYCQKNGEWSAPTMWRCIELQCPVLNTSDIIIDGKVSIGGARSTISCTSQRKYASVCAVNCPLGYLSTGVTNVRCGMDGHWSAGKFRCCPLQCSVLQTPNFATKSCSDARNVGSQCDLTCPEGFHLTGVASVACRANQRWSASLARTRCEVVQECADPTVPNLAHLHCTDGNKVGTLCSLKCPQGEFLRGSAKQVITCLTNLTWDYSFENESCLGPPKCGDLQTVFPDAEWDKLTTTCTGSDNLGSVCAVTCGKNGDGSVVTVCTYNNDIESAWTVPPPRKCINLATQKCDLEMDLSTGQVQGVGNYKKYVTVKVSPTLPIWSMFRSYTGRKECDYQSVVEIDYENLSGFALKMLYEVPSSFHFELSNSKFKSAKAATIHGDNFNIKGVADFAGKGLFPSQGGITFTLKKSNPSVMYKVGSTKKGEIPADFKAYPILFVGLNRAADIQHAYNMGRMGTGLCKFCLSYAPKE